MGRIFFWTTSLLILLLGGGGCSSFQSTEVRLLNYHVEEILSSLEEFTVRLYKKNPKYEQDLSKRAEKIATIYGDTLPAGKIFLAPSHEILTMAFASESPYEDRVFLLSLGLAKSIREAYGLEEHKVFLSGLQVSLERLERLHHNVSQVNWRLKTYRDQNGSLYFLTNEADGNGYINMGYEVIMTEILTRIKDDIYLRGGLPGRYVFDLSTMFLSILI